MPWSNCGMAPPSGHKNRKDIADDTRRQFGTTAAEMAGERPSNAPSLAPRGSHVSPQRGVNVQLGLRRRRNGGSDTPARTHRSGNPREGAGDLRQCATVRVEGHDLEDRVATNCHGGTTRETRDGGIGRHNLTGMQQRLELIGAATPAEGWVRKAPKTYETPLRPVPNTEVTDRGRENCHGEDIRHAWPGTWRHTNRRCRRQQKIATVTGNAAPRRISTHGQNCQKPDALANSSYPTTRTGTTI